MNSSNTTPDVTTVYRFAAIPEWVLYHPDLSAICVRLYGALARHGMQQDRCYPSQARLAHLCGISERSVQVPLRQLEKVGAIKRHLIDGRSTQYELAGDTPLELTPEPASGSAPQEPDPASHSADPALESAYHPASHSADRPALYSAPKESQVEREQFERENPPAPGADAPTASVLELRSEQPPPTPAPSFEQFWDAYDKKSGKLAAERAWKKALKGGAPPCVVAERAAAYRARFNGSKQFMKDPATWLNQGCWMDELEPPPLTIDQQRAERDRRAEAKAAIEDKRRAAMRAERDARLGVS